MNLELEEYVKDWEYYLGKRGRGYSFRFFLERILQMLSDKPINVIEFGGGLSSRHIESYNNVKKHVIIESQEEWTNNWRQKYPLAEIHFDPMLYPAVEFLPRDYFDIVFIDGNVMIDGQAYDSERVTIFIESLKLLTSDGYVIYHDAHRAPAKLQKAIDDNNCILVDVHNTGVLPDINIETWLIKRKT